MNTLTPQGYPLKQLKLYLPFIYYYTSASLFFHHLYYGRPPKIQANKNYNIYSC